MGEFKCNFCSFQYEESNGDTKNGIPKGTPFEQLAGTLCNRCAMQGERHERQNSQPYISHEAEYFDLFTGKSGMDFYKNWLAAFTNVSVLEFGVGTGRIAFEIASLGIDITGIDTSEEMLSIAEKRRKRLSESSKLQLLQDNALSFSSSEQFTHVLLTEGFLQHFVLPEEQVKIIQNVKKHLVNEGFIAIDIILPPNENKWDFHQCKQWGKKRIYQTIHGKTFLSRQIFETTMTYETYERNMKQSEFKVDREYSLILPRELSYLLKIEGFEVLGMHENFQTTNPNTMVTSLMPHLVKNTAQLKRDETLEEELNYPTRNLRAYESNVWTNGGYPLPIQGDITNQQQSSHWTIIAKYTIRENEDEKNK
ncbi:methyltransferase domain-containing protein [Alkalihalobacterium alkalinitrilicum]|uniref:methyltransferase domain-containing protein n=1 Tax=Alkalihalobacterium alkalinitrilicum TaxID=427920 RepID=UPI000994B960|nr:methyltransferase domain-containing protein [Alkalihalobacterium alkalinitrilicum]